MSQTRSPVATAPHVQPSEPVVIDRSGPERYRYTCPYGHTDWDRTNNHVWCRGCRRQNEAGEDVDPEYYELLDRREDRIIPWSSVVIKE